MRILDDDPGRTSAELARHTHVTAQAMNQVLQGLQEIGLVTRPATATSGRALPAQLTRKGKALLKRAEGAVASSDEQLLAHLSRPTGASSSACCIAQAIHLPKKVGCALRQTQPGSISLADNALRVSRLPDSIKLHA